MELLKAFKKIYTLFDKREKRNTVLMLILVAVGAALETVGVGIILPFVSLVLNPGIIDKFEVLKTISGWQLIGTYHRFIVLLCIMLILFYLLKSAFLFFLMFIQNRYVLNRQVKMAKRLFSSYMNKPYEFFFGRNSAELQRNVNILIPAVVTKFLMPALSLLTELLVVLFIFIVLLIADSASALAIVFIFCTTGIIYYIKVKTRLGVNSKTQAASLTNMNKSVHESISSIKEIKVMERERNFVNFYNKNSKDYARAQAYYNLTNQSPRLLVESIVVCGVVFVVLFNILYGSDMNELLPVLSLFAMAAIRIMPSMNRILGYLTSMKFNAINIDIIYEDVREALIAENKIPEHSVQAAEEYEPWRFREELVIQDLTYRYPNSNVNIFENLQLTIKKGQSIGIVGLSGEGKTTLVDLILGLLKPTEGRILVDGADIQSNLSKWKRNLGYVPQNIYLIDDTILKNVAFGIDEKKIEIDKVWVALETAHMKKFVESLPNGLETVVGQRGMLLSGGQRQRIGIARALYNDPEVLILDEATSALDSEIEEQISESITSIGKSKTLIIIAHRVSTLENCDMIYRVDKKDVVLETN